MMTDGEVTTMDLDRLDAAWDDSNCGRVDEANATVIGDTATLRSLSAFVAVSPPVGRRIWERASTRSVPRDRRARRRNAAPSGRPIHLVAQTASDWGWLPAAVFAAAVSLTIVGGILFSGSDGGDATRSHPSGASSVVATLASAAPAWATPGGEEKD